MCIFLWLYVQSYYIIFFIILRCQMLFPVLLIITVHSSLPGMVKKAYLPAGISLPPAIKRFINFKSSSIMSPGDPHFVIWNQFTPDNSFPNTGRMIINFYAVAINYAKAIDLMLFLLVSFTKFGL